MIRSALPAGRWLTVVLLLALSAPTRADEPKPPADPVTAIIDRLVDVDRQDTGYSGSDSGAAFLPLGRNEWHGGLLSPRQGSIGSSEAMTALVKLGVKTIPALIDHLGDDRKTKIVLTHAGGFGGMFITQDDEEKKKDDAAEAVAGEEGQIFASTRYTVRVGDLCYVALGQIVNRPYSAVRYQPTAIVYVSCVPKCKQLRADLAKEWGKLTVDAHRDSLAKDLGSGREHTREGAAVRLAYYHPEAFEPFALKQLTRPTYDVFAVESLIRKQLYPAKTAKERRELVDAFVKAHGEVARDGIRWDLFDDLSTQEADEEGRLSPKQNPRHRARKCLIDVFGASGRVTSKDRPADPPLSATTQARFVRTLLYDRSVKLDRVVRDLLTNTDDDYLAEGCLNRLVGRGYDADVEAYLKRRLPGLEGRDRETLRKYEAKLGWTRLHAAVELGVPDLIEAALKDKLDVNERGKDGRTALHLAAAAGKAVAVDRLLAAKADPNVKDKEGKLAVQRAAFADQSEVVSRLVAAKSSVPDVLVAAIVGDADRLGELLKADPAGVKARTEDGLTPLHLTVREGYEKAVDVLLVAGADVNAVDVPTREFASPDGYTPLHVAVLAGKPGVVKLLLAKGAHASAADANGRLTPLHYAAWGGNADLVRALLAGKADRAAKDEKGRSPIDLAKERKHTEVVKLLEEK